MLLFLAHRDIVYPVVLCQVKEHCSYVPQLLKFTSSTISHCHLHTHTNNYPVHTGTVP